MAEKRYTSERDVVTARVTLELKAKIAECAAAEHRSVGAEIAHALEKLYAQPAESAHRESA